MNNERPTYSATPHYSTSRKLVPNVFDIVEHRGEESSLCFTMSNRGERLQNLLKRGLPLEDAKTVFYQMDG